MRQHGQSNVVDSSAWLEYFADSSAAKHFATAIDREELLIVPSICLVEVFKAVLRQKGEGEAFQVVAFMLRGEVVSLDTQLALEAARVGVEFRLPLADSIVYATARASNAVLWTQDSHFEGLPQVRYFPKP